MAKFLSVALVLLLVWFIFSGVKDIVAKVKAKIAEKKEKECDTAEIKEEKGE